ncbi:LysR family transcriptional regulator [Salipiger marinus]|jgi:DNA-binding transcriptional LysR family regulator|uniref:Transcriptional regulator, LysR family n=1 Tax=Salipiger marinus TaxID=555512 RepID=A0A1G8T922_9RHOB|nr:MULTISPECIES: LysR family transcriptional regulator [Salipiger]MCD1616933.1 LysR family transcriptional regulator [Salipiger manganoxidans]MEB3419960.1 LysR family transcriptional regulator [Salipiger manganoxidans]SDJ37130.1 transcriptional regulator, LysR family [Salipiger marinus]HBM58430.1 LysR family transcriptional regulator [Citreicella sp.]|tara:strand:+ start:168 stop:1064 length:897 start_codon:yes stop_codon:yes gene_type:complete
MTENWDDLRIFLAVARGESLSAAARLLRMDPATVGRRVARLEQGLGHPLFGKSPQGYALSEAGARLLAHAEAAEQALGQGVQALRGAEGTLSGQIRIGAPDGCANFLLPQVCAAISADNPDLDLQIVALPRVVNLTRREADMAIAVSAPSAGRLLVQKLSDYRLHLAASRDYLARHPPIRSRADLQGHRIVGYIPDMIFDKELDYLADLGLDRVRLASNSVAVQFHWLRLGAGLGIVHDFALPAAPGLVRVLPEEVALTRSFYLVRHVDDRRLDRLNRFAAALAEGVRRELSSLEGLA